MKIVVVVQSQRGKRFLYVRQRASGGWTPTKPCWSRASGAQNVAVDSAKLISSPSSRPSTKLAADCSRDILWMLEVSSRESISSLLRASCSAARPSPVGPFTSALALHPPPGLQGSFSCQRDRALRHDVFARLRCSKKARNFRCSIRRAA